MLNWLLPPINENGFSIRPSIFVPAGTLIATAKDMLRLGDVTQEILVTTGIPTPLGEVIIMRARSDGYVQLAGPSITAQLKEVSKTFFELGATQSIIDGALGRKSLGARNVADGIVLCTGASYNMSMDKVIEDTANFCRLMDLPKAETLPPEAAEGLEKCLKEHGEAYIPGALTDSMVVPLLRSGLLRGGRLVVADPSKVLLKPDTLDKLAVREVSLQTKDAARTLCVTVNPVSAYGWKFDKDVFIDRMRQSVKVPVINVRPSMGAVPSVRRRSAAYGTIPRRSGQSWRRSYITCSRRQTTPTSSRACMTRSVSCCAR